MEIPCRGLWVSGLSSQRVLFTVSDMTNNRGLETGINQILFGFIRKLGQFWHRDTEVARSGPWTLENWEQRTYQTSVVHTRAPSPPAVIVLINAYFLFSQSSLASSSVLANWNCLLPCFLTIFCTALAASLIAEGVPEGLVSISRVAHSFESKFEETTVISESVIFRYLTFIMFQDCRHKVLAIISSFRTSVTML